MAQITARGLTCRLGSVRGSGKERPCRLVQRDHLDQLRPRVLGVGAVFQFGDRGLQAVRVDQPGLDQRSLAEDAAQQGQPVMRRDCPAGSFAEMTSSIDAGRGHGWKRIAFLRGCRCCGHLSFEVKYGAQCDVDLDEFFRVQAAREVTEALRVDGGGLLDQYPDILAG